MDFLEILTGGRKNGIDLVERFACLSFLAHHDSNSRIWKISGGKKEPLQRTTKKRRIKDKSQISK